MSKFLTLLVALVTLSVFALDADARRFGGGRTLGKQREAISQQQAAPKPPAQQQQQSTASGTTTPAQQPSGASKWLGPLAGLALGAGLAALFLNNGISGLLTGFSRCHTSLNGCGCSFSSASRMSPEKRTLTT